MKNGIIILIFFLLNCKLQASAQSRSCDIYNVVIDSLYIQENTLNTVYVKENPIKKDTLKKEIYLLTVEHVVYIDKELETVNPKWFLKWSYGIVHRNKLNVLSFISSNDTFFNCCSISKHCLKVIHKVEAEKLNYTTTQYCDSLNKKLPIERFSFSNVLYSKNYTTALVNVAVHRKNLSQSGYSILLIKKGKRWAIADLTYGFN